MINGLDDFKVYINSCQLANQIWIRVEQWDYFSKTTIGKQIVRAVDSIPANLSEGFGRFHYNENKLFCFYARGSLFETTTLLTLASARGLVSIEEKLKWHEQLEIIHKQLNAYIKSIGKSKQV